MHDARPLHSVPYYPRPKPLQVDHHPVTGLLHSSCTSCWVGVALDLAEQPTLGTFIVASIREGGLPSASTLVELLATTFPAFDDRSHCAGTEVPEQTAPRGGTFAGIGLSSSDSKCE